MLKVIWHFTGSGDVGFGTVTMNRALSDTGAITTSYQTLDMGDMGTFHSILLLVL